MTDNIQKLIKLEEKRQEETITLIPSENYSSKEVRDTLASKLGNKYSEGYPGRRYYQGNKIIDEIETVAIESAKKLFGTSHANVQPYSGSPANSAVYFGLLNPGDTIMGLSLASGGHLTHGHPKITFSGKYFNSVQYDVGEDGLIDHVEVEKLARKSKPRIIVAGTTAYPRILDWKKFSDIAESVDAILMADISHIAGLVVAGVHPSPVPFVHVVTTTTHKTLRGPRGAIIMVTQKGMDKDPDMGKKIDRAVFPGLQGGPHNNQTAAIAVAFSEASRDSFRKYGKKIVENAKVLSEELIKLGFNLVSGGTDNHLMLIDLRSKNILGKDAAILLEEGGIVTNYNAIPFDPNPPMNPSGLRIGTPAVTTRGMGGTEMKQIAGWMRDVIEKRENPKKIFEKVKKLCAKFPTPR
ncbi:MAG: Serine hydroxymethyltransferase [Candidatus Woesebacteria bacterium GW2011_GWB1_45_5]|uniref:Serine hydroxymethyltransferase n=1 Tax=Candidatus Woesebacteria bacterium GW2011_GWB1_45_5 TaxID=1618581 RepID=A0A0G1MPQ0_9BACT|nr:MAG: Serine hydroxymethyltransferase [Candidatus Woesebacteria bacterium GW2011_GWB1_45_5]